MKDVNSGETQYLLRKLLTLEADDIALSQPWMWEGARWKELVFALLTRIASLPEDDVRDLTDKMDDLEMLDIPALAEIRGSRTSLDLGKPYARRILEYLQESGLSRKEAQRGLTAICEAALGFQIHHGGKVQRYLRSYGEKMLRELNGNFQFSTLDDAQVKYAFTYWLQNVLGMPLSLHDANVKAFCERHGLTPEQLFVAADELDLNLALVDDLVQRHIARGDLEKAKK